MVSGVSRVQVFGTQKYAVRVQLDPDTLTARNIGIDEVQRAIQASNTNLPTGKLWGDKEAFTVQSSGQLSNAAAYRPIIVAWRNGNPVRLEQLGHVIDGVENERTIAWFNGIRGVILAVQRQPGANTVEVVDNVRKQLQVLKTEIPPAVNLLVAFDPSKSIPPSITTLHLTLFLLLFLLLFTI